MKIGSLLLGWNLTQNKLQTEQEMGSFFNVEHFERFILRKISIKCAVFAVLWFERKKKHK